MTVDVVVGQILRGHGLAGDVVVELRTDEPDRRFVPGAVLTADNRPGRFTIASVRTHQARLLVKFVEVADRTAADALRGVLLVAQVDPADVPDDEEEYYDRQLRGLRVVKADGSQVGTVADVVHLPSQDLLVVDVGGAERFVPFVRALVPIVDLSAGECRLADVPGLIDDEAEDAR